MRWTLKRLAALILAVSFADAVAAQVPAPAAPPSAPAPGEGSGGRRFGGGPPDADMIWKMMNRGQDVDSINLNDRPDLKADMERRGTPIPANGMLTKADFKVGFEKRMAERGSRGPRPGGGDAPPLPPVQVQMVEQPQPSFQPPQGGPPSEGRRRDKSDEPAQRTSVSRFGHLPKGTPPWFEEYDADMDGMVGLYEWRRNGKKIPEFMAMDLNGDGFVTADEWLRAEKLKLDRKLESSAVNTDEPTPVRTEASPSGQSERPVRGQRGGPSSGKDGKDRKKNPFLNGGK